MDKTHCNIIQDLLPLYADDVVSPESRELVERHLTDCPNCRAFLEEIQSSIPIPQRSDDAVLAKIKRKQRRKRMALALFTVFWVVLILSYPAMAIYYQFAGHPKTDFGPDNFIISETEEGEPLLLLNEAARGAHIYYLYEIDEAGNTDLYLYIFDQDPVPERIRLILDFRPFDDEFFMIYNIGPQYCIENRNTYNYYPGVAGFILDPTIQNVYYQHIAPDQHNDFYNNYWSPYWHKHSGYFITESLGYLAPESTDRTLIWSAD